MSNTEVKIADGEKARTSAPIGGKIQYSQVGFAYPSRQDLPVLKGIDLDVEKAKKLHWLVKVEVENQPLCSY